MGQHLPPQYAILAVNESKRALGVRGEMMPTHNTQAAGEFLVGQERVTTVRGRLEVGPYRVH